MRITEIIKGGNRSLSFEVFPPKKIENLADISRAISCIASLNPSYMSVTYGAGGSTDIYTPEMASLVASHGVTPLSHLTCVGADKEKIVSVLTDLRRRGVENILALRGDIPSGTDKGQLTYRYASELVEEIRSFGGFCIGGACYPEGHPESKDRSADIENMKKKINAGCEFLTTQMFFDNSILYGYMDKLIKANICVPVIPGIMPVTAVGQVKRIVSISGNALPDAFMCVIEKYENDPASMKEAGIEFATRQILDLYDNGFGAVHVYSMNKPDVAARIQENVYSVVNK